jgi:hypothetical protein
MTIGIIRPEAKEVREGPVPESTKAAAQINSRISAKW